jgi:ribonuclease HII
MRVLGLDEAGRGSVLGPLVVGAFLFEGPDPAALRSAGADDSKALTARRRARVREALHALGVGSVRVISPSAIDAGNLNALEEDAFVDAVRACAPDRVYLDAPVHPAGIPRVRARLAAATGVRDWVIEPKADATYAVVGAASIFAKLARDEAIAAIDAECRAGGHGTIGSGYPSDPATRAFLIGRIRSGAPLPAFVRTRWGTLDALRQTMLFPTKPQD